MKKLCQDNTVCEQNETQEISSVQKQISETIGEIKKKIIIPLEIDFQHPFINEMKQTLDTHIIGQEHAKKQVCEKVLQSILSVRPKKGPLGVFFFHGPTGVGKTEIIKVLAKVLFDDSDGFTKINCENYQESHTASTIFGAPKGYIGYNDKSPFQNKAMNQPYLNAKNSNKLHSMIRRLPSLNIVLFDEIEKAHPNVTQQFLSLIDEGKIILTNGEQVSFENSLIFFTSNLGEKAFREYNDKPNIGFISDDTKKQERGNYFEKNLKHHFSPEFLGRIHAFVEFQELTPKECNEILLLQVSEYNKYLKEYYTDSNIQIQFSQAVFNSIINEVNWKEKGARELIRYYNNQLEYKISILLNSETFGPYYHYTTPVIIYGDINEDQQFCFSLHIEEDNVLTHQESGKENTNIRPLSLDYLSEVYEIIAKFISLSLLQLEEEIDISDEIELLQHILLNYGLSHNDIARLKTKSYIEAMKDFDFIDNFEGIQIDMKNKSIFYPFETRVIQKIIERTFLVNFEKSVNEYNFIEESTRMIFLRVEKILKTQVLSPNQGKHITLLMRKILLDKYGVVLT